MKVQQTTVLAFSSDEGTPLALWDSKRPDTLRLRAHEISMGDLRFIQSHLEEAGNAIKCIDYSLCTKDWESS